MTYKITKEQLPMHVCDAMDDYPVSHLLQEGSWKRKRILAIGESPALDGRILSWRAFYTQVWKLVASGKRFNELFQWYGWGIEDISFTELCKCVLWPERQLLVSCAPKCWKHLLQQIKYIQPELIIILWKHTLDIFNTMSSMHIPIASLSEQHIDEISCKFLTLYHPSPINPKSKALNTAIMEKYSSALHMLCDRL